jgi:NAD-dependent histone deacetylase SIR2
MTRSARATPIGSLRPSIVLYDEPHPLSEDIGSLQIHDISRQPEVLLIMGTSLKVHGLKRLVKEFAKVIHSPGGNKKRGIVVFVNKTAPPGGEWEGVVDYWVQGETDAWVKLVEDDWRHVKPSDWERQELLDGRVAKMMKKPVAKSKGKGKGRSPCNPHWQPADH